MNSIKILLVQVVLLLVKTHGKRNFEILFDSSNCTVNPDYIKSYDCYVDKTFNPPRGFLDFQMHRAVTTMQYSFAAVALKKNNERMTIFNTTNNDCCSFFEGTTGPTIIVILRDVLRSFGNLPTKCPIAKDYHYVFKDVLLDPERFPPYVPDTRFALELTVYEKKNFIFFFEHYMTIIPKAKNWLG